jgi:hypothetical protein
MSDVTSIRPDVEVPAPKKRKPRGTRGPKIDEKAMEAAFIEQRAVLFQAMGIVRMASETIREPYHAKAHTDAWTALGGAYALMGLVADRLQDSETMLAEEVSRGDY